jgi:hypothetical protein
MWYQGHGEVFVDQFMSSATYNKLSIPFHCVYKSQKECTNEIHKESWVKCKS